jgi:hypothetical protein
MMASDSSTNLTAEEKITLSLRQGGKATVGQILETHGLKAKFTTPALQRILDGMVTQGTIEKVQRSYYQLSGAPMSMGVRFMISEDDEDTGKSPNEGTKGRKQPKQKKRGVLTDRAPNQSISKASRNTQTKQPKKRRGMTLEEHVDIFGEGHEIELLHHP